MAGRVTISRAVAAGLCATVGAQAAAAAAAPPQVADVARQIDRLRDQIDAQQAQIASQQQQIDELRRQLLDKAALESTRAAGLAQSTTAPSSTAQPATAQAAADLPDRPVGEAPAEAIPEVEVAAVPQGQGVLTPAGTLVFDPSLEYVRSSTNRLVFRGIELIPGIQIGVIEASDADRDTLVGTATLRYGIGSRIEIEGRLPYFHRRDRIEVVQQRDEGIVREVDLKENSIGDAELSLRYQFNRPVGQRPVYVGSLRVKSATGKGPFDVDFDEFGVATGLATGSGFWAVSPGINFLLPSDPAVIYGGVSYLWHIARNVDKQVGDARIGRVDPGDAIEANIGFGFALNPRFSYSLGYRHAYIFKTRTEVGDETFDSNTLQAGSLVLGASYLLTPRQSLNLGFQFGVTEDAPDLSFTLRMPFVLAGHKR
jgi:hypothetical protein